MPDRRVRRLSALFCVFLVASLASCGTPHRAGAPQTERVLPPSPSRIAAEADKTSENPEIPETVTAESDPVAETPPPAEEPRGPALPTPDVPEIAALPTPDRLPGPESLVGLPGREISALLGAPDFRRRDPPAELWQYAGPRCTLDLFLFDKNGNGEQRVIHLEARGPTVARVPVRDCYLELVQARRESADGG